MMEATAQRLVTEPVVRSAERITETVERHPQPSLLKRALREPLVHFLLLGLTLFVAYRFVVPAAGQPGSLRIEITDADVRQLQVSWMAQWQRPPTPAELSGLIQDKVRQEVLYREALALGLDQNDEIVKRRMAQKMEFLAEDVSAIRVPQPAELRAWFEKNPARFALPGGITFRHLYFSPDKRGQHAREDAVRALAQLANKPATEGASLADTFMFQSYYADNSPEQVAKLFGSTFAESLFKLKPGSWQGPVESGLGWHLVWIDSMTPGRSPAFEEVDPAQMKSEWMADQRAESKRKAFEAMQSRYEVVLPAKESP
jgi:hypothetical protein